MPMYKVKKISTIFKWIFLILIISVCFFIYDRFDSARRCKPLGYSQEQAGKHALKKLEYQIERHNFSNMSLINSKFEEFDYLWNFEYQDDNKCSVYIIVDSCGATDIGGMSHECIALEKKK